MSSSIASISQNYLTDSSWTAGSSRTASKTLTQEDFLTLVVAEMTNQDPLNPTSNTEYIAQMAQFSALEQSKAMQQDIASLRSEQEIMQANSLLGRAVSVMDDQGNTVRGAVTSVQLEDGTPKLQINGHYYSLDSLLSIEPATTNNS